MSDIQYEIVKKLGTLSKSTSGWTKELNLVSWNDREPKYDIRDWSACGWDEDGQRSDLVEGGVTGVEGAAQGY